MNNYAVGELKRIKSLLMPAVTDIHRDWLLTLVPAKWLDRCLTNAQALKQINHRWRPENNFPKLDPGELQAHQRWLLLSIDAQNELALQLGTLACVDYFKRLIAKREVLLVAEQLDKESLSSIVQDEAIEVQGVSFDDFRLALHDSQLHLFLVGVGISLLENSVPEHTEFFELRMKFAFPRHCWLRRPKKLISEGAKLTSWLIHYLSEQEQAYVADL